MALRRGSPMMCQGAYCARSGASAGRYRRGEFSMTGFTMAFGNMICGAVQFAGIAAPRCYNPADLAFVGALFMTFLSVLTIGWQAAKRV
jgi:hypothetical protein